MGFWDRWVLRIYNTFVMRNPEGLDAACELFQLAYDLGLVDVSQLHSRSLAVIILSCGDADGVGPSAADELARRPGRFNIEAGDRPGWHWELADQLIEATPRNLEDLIDVVCRGGPRSRYAFEALELHFGLDVMRFLEMLGILINGQLLGIYRSLVSLIVRAALNEFCLYRRRRVEETNDRRDDGTTDFTCWLYRYVIDCLRQILDDDLQPGNVYLIPEEQRLVLCCSRLGQTRPMLPWLVFLSLFGNLNLHQILCVLRLDLPLDEVEGLMSDYWTAILKCMSEEGPED